MLLLNGDASPGVVLLPRAGEELVQGVGSDVVGDAVDLAELGAAVFIMWLLLLFFGVGLATQLAFAAGDDVVHCAEDGGHGWFGVCGMIWVLFGYGEWVLRCCVATRWEGDVLRGFLSLT